MPFGFHLLRKSDIRKHISQCPHPSFRKLATVWLPTSKPITDPRCHRPEPHVRGMDARLARVTMTRAALTSPGLSAGGWGPGPAPPAPTRGVGSPTQWLGPPRPFASISSCSLAAPADKAGSLSTGGVRLVGTEPGVGTTGRSARLSVSVRGTG